MQNTTNTTNAIIRIGWIEPPPSDPLKFETPFVAFIIPLINAFFNK
jgi:hypothetical protein